MPGWRSFRGSCTWLLLLLAICIIEHATVEKISLQRYLPMVSQEELLNNNKRFQHFDVGWPQPPKIKTEQIDVKAEIAKLNSSYVLQSAWPDASIELGPVTDVSFDKAGNVVIFSRAERTWDMNSFDTGHNYRHRKKGPIRGSTVLAIDRSSGKLVYDWGKDLFYMPHGLTVDHEDNIWLTDCAMHQVFKFGPRGSNNKPLMTLGTAFTPGAGETKFCKPTSVAVIENGDFFIADGYCNARILKYSKSGEKILSWGQNTYAGVPYDEAPKNFFNIPHEFALVPSQELICVADRENGRVQCFFWGNGTFHSQYHDPIIGDRLFSMDYSPEEGGQLIIVNGPSAEVGVPTKHYNEVRGFVLNMNSKKITSKFGPNDLQFDNPHDVAVTADGLELYVTEMDPKRVHKFLHKSKVRSMSLSAATPTSTKTHTRPGGTAILVASLMLLFALLTFAMALLIARRRKRGNAELGVGQPNELVYRKLDDWP